MNDGDEAEAAVSPAHLRTQPQFRPRVGVDQLAHRLGRARLLLKARDVGDIRAEKKAADRRLRRQVFEGEIETFDLLESEVLEARVHEQHVAGNAERDVTRGRRRAHDEAREVVFVIEDELRIEARDRVLDFDVEVIERDGEPRSDWRRQHDPGGEILGIFGVKVRVAAGENLDRLAFIFRRAGDDEAPRIAQLLRKSERAGGGLDEGRRAEASAPRTAQQHPIRNRSPGEPDLRIHRRTEVAVVLAAQGDLHLEAAEAGNRVRLRKDRNVELRITGDDVAIARSRKCC